MDTLTHALVGGVIGYMVAGKNGRKKALLWGAGIAVLPDLDVFIPYDTDLDNMTFHRSWTHSWLVQTAFAPMLATLLHRIDSTFSFKKWLLIIWLALIAHSGLDALTVYGTQLFWPFMPSPFSGGSIFIIDPTFTLPLLIACLFALISPNASSTTKWLPRSFMFSALYLIWGLAAQQWMLYEAKQNLAQQNIQYDRIQVSASAFNTLLWRILVINEEHYYEGFSSLFDDDNDLQFTTHKRGSVWLTQTQHLDAVQRIRWFTNDMFKLEQLGHNIVAYDLRMGLDPNYFFQFKIAELQNDRLVPSIPNRVHVSAQRKASVRWVWQRIWNPSVQFNTVPELTKG